METYELYNEAVYKFKVLPFEIDFRKKVNISALVGYILNSVSNHAEFCHYGIEDLKSQNLSWVVLRVSIDMVKYPKMYDYIYVKTWCEGFAKIFTKKNFVFYDANGGVLGSARTIWALIDKETRRPANVSNVLSDRIVNPGIECPASPLSRIPSLAADVPMKSGFSVSYSDVDFNQHLSSCKYVEHVMDAFSLHKFEKRDVKRFEIDFIEECYFSDEIGLYKKEYDNNVFVIELHNQAGSPICRARITFGGQDFVENYNPGHKLK